MEALLTSLGVGWLKRKAASAIGYGVGKLVQTIVQEGDQVSVSNVGGQKDFQNDIVVGTEQQVDSVDGTVTITTSWDTEGNMVMNTEMMGKPVVIVRKMIDNTTMHLLISHNGVSATRIFTRK